MKIGDRIKILGQVKGVIVANIDSGEYSPEYPAKDWQYLERGLLVIAEGGGLVHLPADDVKLDENSITPATMLESMWAAYPDWVPEEDTPLYMALADDVAVNIWRRLQKGDVDYCKPAFAIIERWLAEGDVDVGLACSVGLFERVKHASGAKQPETMRLFKGLLGPASRKEWTAV